MTHRITAPWTEQQVAALNASQRSGVIEPLTCQMPHRLRQTLIAERDGWHCPDEQCDYRQDWADSFMANPVTLKRTAILEQLVKNPALVELAKVRGQLRETERQLAQERRRTADLSQQLTTALLRIQALQVHEAIQRIPAPPPDPDGGMCDPTPRQTTPTNVPTGELL